MTDAAIVEEQETTAAHVLRVRMTIGLHQRTLAQLLGVSERTVRRWEGGAPVRRVYIDRMDDMLRRKETSAIVQSSVEG